MIHLRMACGYEEAETCMFAAVVPSAILVVDLSVRLIAVESVLLPLFLLNLSVWNVSESPKWPCVLFYYYYQK